MVRKLRISDAEEALRTQQEELDKAFQNKMTALQQEYEKTKERLNNECRSRTQLMHFELEDLEIRLAAEEAFIAPLRKIPEEILAEILHHYLDGQTPERKLSLVCKEWRAILLRTPSFWRNLRAFMINSDYNHTFRHIINAFGANPNTPYAAQLQRRIELSRSTLLDISLSLDTPAWGEATTELFELLAKTDLKRWRSLTLIVGYGWYNAPSLDGIFEGTLSSLQSLKICLPFQIAGQEPFIPIYQLIAKSKPPLKELDGPISETLFNANIFQKVSKITTTESSFANMRGLRGLEDLHITTGINNSIDLPHQTSTPLPRRTKLDGMINANQLHSLQLYNVEDFEVSGIAMLGFDAIIDFPRLSSLRMRDDVFSTLSRISAPNLSDLEISTGRQKVAEKKQASTTIISLLRDTPESVTIKPTSLTMDIGVTSTAVLAILQHWPQLQHLTIAFGSEFTWKGAFPNAFNRKRSPLCPQLITLRLDSRSTDFRNNMEQWEAIAKTIISTRKNMPMKQISWRGDELEWYSVSSDDAL